MLLTVDIDDKIIGNKHLLHDLHFFVEDGEKIGVVGRNGVGKTTLFNVLSGEDTEYEGEVVRIRDARMLATRQEHHDLGDITALDYILQNLPDYKRLKHVIDTYPDHMGDNMKKISDYSDALATFSEKGYYDILKKCTLNVRSLPLLPY